MSKPLAFGLNLKKPGASKPAAPRRKPMFGGDDSDSDSNTNNGDSSTKVQAIGGDLDDDFGASRPHDNSASRKPKSKPGLTAKGPPPKLNAKTQHNAMFGDLSSSLASRKNAEAAAEVDANVYEYDNVYDSFKPKKQATKEDVEKKPKYMKNLIQAADVRKRDLLIAEEKKIAREREAEGDEFADKEKFVTAAYKKQQEENRRLEEEEKRKEEEEAKKNKGGGMSAFYRQMLDRDGERHAESMKAAEEMAKNASDKKGTDETPAEQEDDDDKAQTARAQAMNEKGASVDVNEDGQVVDKRQLLRGGLNLDGKKKAAAQQQKQDNKPAERERKDNYAPGQAGRRQAMRERQSRMMEEQLEQSMKRAYEEEESKKQEVERASKSRKTEGEISSAKERFLARKRAAEEAKKAGEAAP